MMNRTRINVLMLSVALLPFAFSSCDEVGPTIDLTDTEYETGVGTPETPQNKVVLIEDFTGAACPNCPDAHIAISDAISAHPGRVTAIAEYNYFADPLYIEQNLTTTESYQLDDYMGPVVGWPASFIDRTDFEADGYIPEVPANIASYVNDQLALSSPCNIEITPTFDAATRNLHVLVKVAYTSDVTNVNHLSVALVESGIIAAQIDDNVGGEVEDYVHNHVLRKFLSFYLGEALPEENVAGRWYTFEYDYTLPDTWNADNMAVIGFVHNFETENKTVIQAAEADL
ncbi:MAG TPA: Omp28-related outer membrane protein [Chitinophagales bacterium]|nr:Omp28-related outer membrane protein [Chitinophagales bacterium]HMU68488.1 Omp28-related outer membrane protein [Chitinophagales bacterium]HMX04011.1 Omp28-related outer membrane protein [Chitinophagales bacterium]HMZ88362.1 Omp28-related outer membrane protein [Chitinophagales bacterium]HNA58297.1 Omp28-related outer membrane protein [Chitinophagales bacterium]